MILEANAEGIHLDFEGINDHTSVSNFYLADYNISFELRAAAYKQSAETVTFSNPPSPETIVYSNTSFNMMHSSGFSDALSFYYSNNQSTIVTVFDASNNTLASLTIESTGNTDPNAPDSWQQIILPFDGVATRVEFGGDTLYDNIHLGTLEIPTLSNSLKLLLALLLAFISIKHLYRKKYV